MNIWAAWIQQVVGLLAWLGCKEQNIDILMFPGFTWEMFKQECKYKHKHPRRCEYGGNAECYNGNVVSANTKMIGQIKVNIL